MHCAITVNISCCDIQMLLQYVGHHVAGDAAPDDVLQDRADLAVTSLNTSEKDTAAAQKEYVKSLVTR